MSPQGLSGIPLFKLFGIQVYLHWSWILVAVFAVQSRAEFYSSLAWNVAEYVSLFVIVLMHEFGHSLACRSVGGRADRILLWPLGGVAFVDPPQRPGAVLWSIAAGPLVNVGLFPITFGLYYWTRYNPGVDPNIQSFVFALYVINLGLLIFNMLPIYPLDGGQILRAILWYFVGDARSLMIASVVGLLGAAAGIAVAMYLGSVWLIIIAAFAALQSWMGFQRSRALHAVNQTPRHPGLRCPTCNNAPPALPVWTCTCGRPFDVFASRGQCPICGAIYPTIPCPFCGKSAPPMAWQTIRVTSPAQN
jgi:Zn-dependent protease